MADEEEGFRWTLPKLAELFKAVKDGDYETVREGLDNGFSIDRKWDWTMGGEFFGKTIVDVAIKHGQDDILELINSYRE